MSDRKSKTYFEVRTKIDAGEIYKLGPRAIDMLGLTLDQMSAKLKADIGSLADDCDILIEPFPREVGENGRMVTID